MARTKRRRDPEIADLGARMCKSREEAGMTHAEVAFRCGVTENTVRRWEKGDVDVPWSAVSRFATAVGKPVAAIVGRKVVGEATVKPC
jgi:DNA-binding XRE family transcriptional regulator